MTWLNIRVDKSETENWRLAAERDGFKYRSDWIKAVLNNAASASQFTGAPANDTAPKDVSREIMFLYLARILFMVRHLVLVRPKSESAITEAGELAENAIKEMKERGYL